MAEIFDCHAHYKDNRFDADRDALLSTLFAKGVCGIVEAGVDLATSRESLALAEQYPNLYAAVGFYPHHTHEAQISDLDAIAALLDHPKAVAIGEIGLDYYYDDSPKETQQRWFDLQLDLAAQTGYPVCIHDRDAHGDCLKTVQNHPGARGMFHSFSGSAQTAKELLRCGYLISFSGTVTFKNAQKVREAAAAVPLTEMLLETDAPYLTAVPFRGQRNRSDHILYVAQTIADIHGVTTEAVLEQTTKNAKQFYRIP